MKFKITTSKGDYIYKLKIVYEGIKKIDKTIAKENLLLFNKIAKKNGLKYALAYGSILGAIREHDFIEHDEDIDLAILKEHADLFKSMLFELRDYGFEVIRYDRRGGLCSLMRKGEYIDIYIYNKLQDGIMETLADPMPEKYLINTKEIEFQGDIFHIPNEVEEYLLLQYGTTWRTPIQRDNFKQSEFRKVIWKIKWLIYYILPDKLFIPWIERRGKEKIIRYNRMVRKFNTACGRIIHKELPTNCYKVYLDR